MYTNYGKKYSGIHKGLLESSIASHLSKGLNSLTYMLIDIWGYMIQTPIGEKTKMKKQKKVICSDCDNRFRCPVCERVLTKGKWTDLRFGRKIITYMVCLKCRKLGGFK